MAHIVVHPTVYKSQSKDLETDMQCIRFQLSFLFPFRVLAVPGHLFLIFTSESLIRRGTMLIRDTLSQCVLFVLFCVDTPFFS